MALPGMIAFGGRDVVLTPVVWNSADKTASLALSNGDRTATASSTNQGVRGTVSKSSGKWYFEVVQGADVWSTATTIAFGVALSSVTLGSVALGTDTASIGIRSNGSLCDYNGGSTTIDPTCIFSSVGDVLMVAIDIGAAKIWFGSNGSWGGVATVAGDPAAGTTPLISGFGTGPWFPMITRSGNGDIATINASAAQCTYAAPSGFSYWGS